MKFYFVFILIFVSASAISQALKVIKIYPRSDYYVPKLGEAVEVKNPYTKKLTFVFEQEFNDSVVIYVNNIKKVSKRMKTLHPLGVCGEDIIVAVPGSKNKIDILFVERSVKITFSSTYGKPMCYISFDKSGYDVFFSKYCRYYPPM